MCGVAGILGKLDDPNRVALRRMTDAMQHRGPDGGGVWESTPDARGEGALLGHRRLAILDLSPAAAQPLVDPLTGQVIVFNGEIYNFRSIRDRLGAKAEKLDSTGDTAVLLRALGVEGQEALGWLRGMFAIALWNPARRDLLLARDPLGIKPLYFARGPIGGRWSLAFASEVRALLASGLLGHPRLNPRAVASVIWNGFVVGPDTTIAGVDSIQPGELRRFDGGGLQLSCEDHWSAEAPSGATPACEVDLSCAVEESLRAHLVSDVPIGICLSSGIDSSAVANLAQRHSSQRVRTFTLVFEEPEFNEGPWARRIAAAIGTQHEEVLLSEQNFQGELEQALDSLDQPTFDGLNSYFLSRAIRDAGLKVALSGTGGDELFGGYTSFRDLPRLQRLARRPLPGRLLGAAARGVTEWLGASGPVFPSQSRWAKLPDMLERGATLLDLYQLAYALFLPKTQHDLLGANVAGVIRDGLPPSTRARVTRETRGRSALSAISVMEERLFLGERLLRDGDAASMAASIEQRLPLVDRVLFEVADRLPDRIRYQPLRQKRALRRLGLRGLDPVLFERPKTGFVLPFQRWLRSGLNDSIDATLRDESATTAVGLDPTAVRRLWAAFCEGSRGIYWSRIWSIYVYVRWCQRHGVTL